MAHMWHRLRHGLKVAGKIAGVVGTAALAAHAIHKGLSGQGDAFRPITQYTAQVHHHGVARTVRFDDL